MGSVNAANNAAATDAGHPVHDTLGAADLRQMCGAMALIVERMTGGDADPLAPALRGRALRLVAAMDRMLLTASSAAVAARYAGAVLDLSHGFLAMYCRRPPGAPAASAPAPSALDKTIAALNGLIAKVGRPPATPAAGAGRWQAAIAPPPRPRGCARPQPAAGRRRP
jgi:hypothetical protein